MCNNWTIKFTKKSQKELQKLDKPIQHKIITELDKILLLEHPRDSGKSLTGSLSGLWRYRVSDYRIIAEIEDNVLTIVVVRVAHRKEVYD